MDDEHKECTDSFNKVIEDPTPDNFQLLFNILKSHFDHEEELMKTYSEDNEERKTSSSSFSAIDSHKMDHQRMLKIAETELERVIGCGTKWHKEYVDLAVVREIIDAFHVHAERFDALYHSKVPVWAK